MLSTFKRPLVFSSKKLTFYAILLSLCLPPHLKSDFSAGLSFGYAHLKGQLSHETKGSPASYHTFKTHGNGPSLDFGYDFPLPFIILDAGVSFSPNGLTVKKTFDGASVEFAQKTAFTLSVNIGPHIPFLLLPYAKLAFSAINTRLQYWDTFYNQKITKWLGHIGYGLGVKKTFLGFTAAIEYLYSPLQKISHHFTNHTAQNISFRASQMKQHSFSLSVSYSF